MSNYTETNIFPETIPEHPKPNALVLSNELRIVLSPIINRTRNLINLVNVLNAYVLNMKTFFGMFNSISYVPINLSSISWDSSYNTAATTQVWNKVKETTYWTNNQALSINTGFCYFDFDTKFGMGSYIKSITLQIKGPPAAGGLPANMPYILAIYTDLLGQTFTITGTGGTDTSTSVSDFKQFHNITLTFVAGSRHYVDPDTINRYSIQFCPGYGAQHTAGLQLWSGYVTYTNEA